MTVLLNGVVTGTTVTINDKTVEQWDGFNAPGPTGDATVTVEVTRSALRTAPEGVFFKAVDWTGFDTVKGDVANFDNRQMDLIHIWSFGDPGSRYDVPEKLLPEWRDANTARGPFASHVYECLDGFTEGVRSHTWNLTVIEPSTGRIATASGVIDVTDPNVTFAGDLTAYVSEAGNFADCPAAVPSNRRFTTLGEAKDAVLFGPRGRIMFARGEDFIIGSGIADISSLSVVGGYGATHFVAGPGTGTRPRMVLHPDAATTPNSRIATVNWDFRGGEYVVSGLHHQGPWDSTTESGGQAGGYSIRGQGLKLFNQCSFDGVNPVGCLENETDPDTGGTRDASMTKAEAQRINHSRSSLIMNGVVGRNGSNYALFGTGQGRIAVLGTQLAHESDARSGGTYRVTGDGGEHPLANHSGSVRVEGNWPTDMVVDGADMFSRCGWYRNLSQFRTIQPCLRFNTNSEDGFFINVQRSSFEGGGSLVVISRQNTGERLTVTPALIEHCIFTPSHMTASGIDLMGGCAAIRSILVNVPDVRPITEDFTFRRFVNARYESNNGDYPEVFLPKLEVTGVTFIDHCSPANRGGRGVELLSLFDPRNPDPNPHPRGPVVYENNIVHTPNIADPNGLSGFDEASTQSGPLDDTPLWAPREIFGPIVSYLEYKDNFPARFHRGDTITLPHPPGTDASTFTAPGAPNPKSWMPYGPITQVEHLPDGIRITNVSPSRDKEAGEEFILELDVGDNPIRYPQYASPLDTVQDGTPGVGSSARGAANVAHAKRRVDGRMQPRPDTGATVGWVEA